MQGKVRLVLVLHLQEWIPGTSSAVLAWFHGGNSKAIWPGRDCPVCMPCSCCCEMWALPLIFLPFCSPARDHPGVHVPHRVLPGRRHQRAEPEQRAGPQPPVGGRGGEGHRGGLRLGGGAGGGGGGLSGWRLGRQWAQGMLQRTRRFILCLPDHSVYKLRFCCYSWCETGWRTLLVRSGGEDLSFTA